MSWTDDQVLKLRALWADGLSAGQIARQLGPGHNRNTVIGKVHRLGIVRSPEAAKPTMRAQAARTATQSRTTPASAPTPRKPAPARQAAPPAAAPAVSLAPEPTSSSAPLPESSPSTLVQLDTSCRCRWPLTGFGTDRPMLDGADTLFCGALRRAEDDEYCPSHRKLAGSSSRTPRQLRDQLRGAERLARSTR